jgi:hypothetical protein
LRRISLPYPDYPGIDEALGIGSKKQAHQLARGKGGIRSQSQAERGKVNSGSEVFSLVALDHESHSYSDTLTLHPALD